MAIAVSSGDCRGSAGRGATGRVPAAGSAARVGPGLGLEGPRCIGPRGLAAANGYGAFEAVVIVVGAVIVVTVIIAIA